MDTNLNGLDSAGAREYIYGFISTLKLTEKKMEELAGEIEKWESRASLAKSKGLSDLQAQAEKQAGELKDRRQVLEGETAELKTQIEAMQRQLPSIAARARSVDPDLLEQELLMAAGYNPGEEDKARSDRAFSAFEKEAAADDALLALKAKMGK
ncbi:MAG: chromosome partitioning protein [Spirochaetes bacterium]|nr:chromosome partitioning protein [Spirochaetota bacterium]